MKIYKLLQEQHGFTNNESILADYILKHPHDVLNMSIYDLSKKTHVSNSTIVRLCQKLNLSGFREFKTQLNHHLATTPNDELSVDVNVPFLSIDTEFEIANKIASLSLQTIQETKSLLNPNDLRQVTKLLSSAENILGIGVSECFIRLTAFQSKLLKINKYVRLVSLQAEQFYLATYTTDKDVAIIISYSGETAEIVNDARLLKKNGTKIIAITSSLTNSLAKYATTTLLIPNEELSNNKISNFSSQIAIDYLLNVIYSCLFKHNYENNYSQYKQTPKSKF